MRRLTFYFLLVALWGCRSNSPALAPDASVTQDVPLDAGLPAEPPALTVSLTLLQSDGGSSTVTFDGGAFPIVEPASQLEVTANLGLQNFRVRIFDETDRALSSDDKAVGDESQWRYHISLLEPLKSGNRYFLMLDAQSGAEMLDMSGRPHPDARLEFKTSGEKEKPAPKTPPKKSNKKKRRQ